MDDIVFVGWGKRRNSIVRISKRIRRDGMAELPFLFDGCNIEEKGGILKIQQFDHSRSVARLRKKSGFSVSTRRMHELDWLLLTWLRKLGPVHEMVQVTEKTFGLTHLKDNRNSVSQAHECAHIGLSYSLTNGNRNTLWRSLINILPGMRTNLLYSGLL